MPNKRTLKLTKKQKKKLESYRDHDPRPYVRERCAAILKIANGESANSLSKNGLLKPRQARTLYHWLNLYQEQGIEGLINSQQGGNHRKDIPDKQKLQLFKRLRRSP